MNNSFVTYAHMLPGTSEVFYIGEGRMSRAYDKRHRNRYWKNVVSKYGGFDVYIIKNNLSKIKAEKMERRLIRLARNKGLKITNICDGVLFGNTHWLVGKDKSLHPMYGKKNPEASERMRKRNKELVGELSPVFGLKRPDLIERNKSGNFKRRTRNVFCKELGKTFSSIKEAKRYFGGNCNINRAIKTNGIAGGYHWCYID